MKKRSSLKIMMQLIGLIRPLALILVLAVTMGAAGFLAAIFITVLGGYGILNVIGISSILSLKGIFICLLAFAAARGILRYAEQACNHYIAFKLLALIRDRIFAALRKLAPAKLECRDKGNLISIITSDIELLEVFYAHTISPCCIAVIVSLMMTFFVGQYHVVLGILAAAAYLCVGVLLPLLVSKRADGQGDLFREKFGGLNAYFMDSMRGLSEIIQYGIGAKRLSEINRQSDQMSEVERKMKVAAGTNSALIGMMVMLLTLVMFFMTVVLRQRGMIGFDGVVIASLAMASSFGPVIAVANLGTGLAQTLASGNRVLDLLEDQPVVDEIFDGEDIEFTGAKLDQVSFSYEEATVLDQVSLSLEKGSITGIVGKSGSGKSTMLKLLMHFWEAKEGGITLSGKEIKSINTASLRDNESYMTQETQLFCDTIENNIKIAKLDATREEIITACQKASVHDFIMSLPEGYDTWVGELGSTLSGGERQRIGLARAILHDAPLLLLDEPTSNLDSLNEAVILKALRAEEERTVVLVSHRPSTMKIADCSYEMKAGRMS